jgi:hypothetical protein
MDRVLVVFHYSPEGYANLVIPLPLAGEGEKIYIFLSQEILVPWLIVI